MTVKAQQKYINRRAGAKLRAVLREQIFAGHVPPGELFPSIRQLSQEHHVTRETANRSLKALVEEGLLTAEPRRGYRVRVGACDPDRGCPVAFVDQVDHDWYAAQEAGQEDYAPILRAGVTRHGWSLLAVGGLGRDSVEVMREIATARACGVIVSGLKAVAQHARSAGYACVGMDWWEDDISIDSVVQDDFQGGVLAARYLLERGHDRVAWVGHTTDSYHSMARIGGATSELLRGGVSLPSEMRIECAGPEAKEEALKLFTRPDRPRAILALWTRVAAGVYEAALELGLKPGRDFDMVGWAREEKYERDYIPIFGEETVPAAIVWSSVQMGELAVERLAARRQYPEMAPVKICVPVRLIEANGSVR